MEDARPFVPYDGTNPYVFISYSHKDSARVLPILAAMSQRGYRVWYDNGIPWAAKWRAEIEKRLRDCAVCIAFLSRASVKSEHCQEEIFYAKKKGKPIFPAYLEDVQLENGEDGLESALSPYQGIKLYDSSQIDAFLARLEREPAFAPCRGPVTNPPKPPEPWWRVLLPFLLVIVLLGAFVVYRLVNGSKKPVPWGSADTHLNEYVALLQKRKSPPTVTVAVVSSGVDMDNPAFENRLVDGYDFFDADELPQDEHGNGTARAGIIAENTPDNVKIMPVRVLNADDKVFFSSVVSHGIHYAVNHGANVICCMVDTAHADDIESAIQDALDHNITVVVSAGNKSKDTRDCCPAHIKDCITVSSVGKSWVHSSFSNYGDAVDICAPGEQIPVVTLDGTAATQDGTGLSAAYVAAAVADIMTNRGTDQTPAQIEAALKQAAYDLGDPGWDKYYGAGFLDMSAFFAESQ